MLLWNWPAFVVCVLMKWNFCCASIYSFSYRECQPILSCEWNMGQIKLWSMWSNRPNPWYRHITTFGVHHTYLDRWLYVELSIINLRHSNFYTLQVSNFMPIFNSISPADELKLRADNLHFHNHHITINTNSSYLKDFFCYLFFRDLRCLRNTIHANLFSTYILTSLLWLVPLALGVSDVT